EILRNNGVFAFIVSNKWMRAGYGAKVREYLGTQRIHQLLDFGEQPVFEATAYTCILISERTSELSNELVLTWSFSDLPLNNLSDFIRLKANRQNQSDLVTSGYSLDGALG